MNYTKEQVVGGIIDYIDNEIINQMATPAKVIISTGIGLAKRNIENTIGELSSNQVIKALGIIDDNGLIDIDTLSEELRTSMSKVGQMTISLPFNMGQVTLVPGDVDTLVKYIER